MLPPIVSYPRDLTIQSIKEHKLKNRDKMKEDVTVKADDISIVQKRLEILWSTRFTDRTEVEEAVRIQERLSKKSPDGWSGTEEIRKWRDRGAGT